MNLANSALIPESRSFDAAKSRVPARQQLIDAAHPLRRQVERFIAQRFEQVHAARIRGFMPELLALFDDNGEVLAAVGIRAASRESLFLEHYLDAPVEQAISDKALHPLALPQRDRIVEIGNLASIDRRASRKLFTILAGLLHVRKFEWAVFTGCTSLQRMFKTMGIETLHLGRALQSCLPGDQQTWGSYYENRPRVVAGKVSRGCAVFSDQPELSPQRAVA